MTWRIMILLLLGGLTGWGAARTAFLPYESGAAASPRNAIDEAVFRKLDQLGIPPAPLCSDAVFLRRVYLDVIGTLPTAQEARKFLLDRAANKRAALIDHLLERDEFAEYWAMKWSNLLRVKSEFPINLWPNAVQAYHRWIRSCLRENLPYDQFVRKLLTASGSNFRVPEVNFYRALQSKEARGIAQAVALTFMGMRAEQWPKERWANLAVFFSQVGYKSTEEWKEEIVFHDLGKAADGAPLRAVLPDGSSVDLPPGQDPRSVFADWLVNSKNSYFTRHMANRAWSWLLGRGIIHEPDDLGPDRPCRNPELLAVLEIELATARYDLKQLFRLILNSSTYQLSSLPATDHPEAEAHFAFYPARRLEAEVLIDALNQVTGGSERYSSPIPEPFTFIPENQRSISLADGSITSPFLDMFGRPARDTGLESERNNRPTASQRLHLLNSSHIQRKIEQSPKLRALIQGKHKPRFLITELYLTILSRFPTESEYQAVEAYGQSSGTKDRDLAVDLVWALVNSAEFAHRH